MRIAVAILLSAMFAGPALAQQMNAEIFYQRAIKLQKKGPLALFSRSEINVLMAEGKAAGNAASRARRAAGAAGQTPRFCPPEGRNQ